MTTDHRELLRECRAMISEYTRDSLIGNPYELLARIDAVLTEPAAQRLEGQNELGKAKPIAVAAGPNQEGCGPVGGAPTPETDEFILQHDFYQYDDIKRFARKLEREKNAFKAVADMDAYQAWQEAIAERNEAQAELAVKIEQLKHANTAYELINKDCLNLTEKVIPNIREQLAAANKRADEEKAIVDKIWAMFGPPTYEELNGRSIYDLIEKQKCERDEAQAKFDDLVQRLNGVITAEQIMQRLNITRQ